MKPDFFLKSIAFRGINHLMLENGGVEIGSCLILLSHVIKIQNQICIFPRALGPLSLPGNSLKSLYIFFFLYLLMSSNEKVMMNSYKGLHVSVKQSTDAAGNQFLMFVNSLPPPRNAFTQPSQNLQPTAYVLNLNNLT